MSYILEALRRAQSDRQAQPLSPQSGQAQDTPAIRLHEPLPRALLAGLAGAGGAVLTAGLLWLFWPQAEVAPPSAFPAEQAVIAPVATASTSPAEIGAGISSMDELTESDIAVPAEEAYATGPAEVAPLAPENLAELQEMPAAPAIERDSTARPETSSRTVQLEPPAETTRTLRDMPDDYRNAFPKLKVEVHVYDDDPASRFVLIEGRRYREGEALSQGPVVSEITPDGVVFSFRNAEVLVPVGY